MRSRLEQFNAIRDRMQPSFDREPKPPHRETDTPLTFDLLRAYYDFIDAHYRWSIAHNMELDRVIEEEIKK